MRRSWPFAWSTCCIEVCALGHGTCGGEPELRHVETLPSHLKVAATSSNPGLRWRGPVCDIFTDRQSKVDATWSKLVVQVQFATLYLFVILLCPAHLLTVLVQALLKEVVAYRKMEKLWGVFVPRLIGYGTTNNGRIVFVATELIEGVELGEGRFLAKLSNAEYPTLYVLVLRVSCSLGMVIL